MGTTQTFPAWLAAQDTRTDEVGELAKHVAGLGDFPQSGGKAIYDGYFETERSSRREVFERAWAEYSTAPQPVPEADGRQS
jgi:predicted NUDIX family NTP pyrophosphohydrolase